MSPTPSVAFAGRRTGQIIVPPSGGGATTGTLTVLVKDGSSVAVAGGTVELYNSAGTQLLLTATPNGSGSASFLTLTPGTYVIKYHAPLAFSLGASEPDTRTVTVTAGNTTTQNIVALAADYAPDFNTFTTSAQFTDVTNAAGNFFAAAPNGQNQKTIGSGGAIVRDATGGFGGNVAFRYDYPAQPANLSDYTIQLNPRFSTANISDYATSIYWRTTSKEGATQWEHGASAAVAARAYKFLELTFDNANDNSRCGVYLGDAAAGALSTTVFCDFIDRWNNGTQSSFVTGHDNSTGTGPQNTNLGNPYGGVHNTWVIGLLGLGTNSAVFKLWLNGALISSLTNSCISHGPTTVAITFSFGANINNGPDHAQSRWFSEAGVYKTRPSLRQIGT